MSSDLRLLAAAALVAAWMLLLFSGHLLGGAAHLALAAALALFPWSRARSTGADQTPEKP